MTNKIKVTSLAFASLVVGASVSAGTLLDKEINDGSAPMYSQVTHTGNVVFINASEEVFFPCRCRQIKGEPPCCPVHYPSLGSLYKRHSPDVVELGKGKGFWCKFSSLKMPEGHKRGDNFPINWCHKSGWVEGVKPESFSNRSNIGEPHALILHPAVIDQTKLKGFN